MITITIRQVSRLFSLFLAAAFVSPIAAADDVDDVRAVVNEYLATEGTDLERQASLMIDDRVFIAGGLRQTDNVANMRNQIAAAKRNRELDPKTQVSVTGEDIMIKVYGGAAAVASFYRYWNVLPSADSIRAGRNPQGPPPDAVTLVLAKMGNDWKIVHTHQSPIGGN